MSHSRLFSNVKRLMRIARFCDEHKLSTDKGLERIAEIACSQKRKGLNRREFINGLASAAALAAMGSIPFSSKASAGTRTNARIAIIGGGLAGLVCADWLQGHGVQATIYEANPRRLGGRCYSNRMFPGQVAENGGELIDNPHKTILGYANKFNLLREDLGKSPGAIFYYFNGRRYSEAEVVDEYRVLVARMSPDLQSISSQPTFFDHTDADVALDNTDLAAYLDTRGAGLPLIQKLLKVAYNIEYGREPSEQSCLNLLLFIHLDRRSKFAPFGIFSDERYHLIAGNDSIVAGIGNRLEGPVELGSRLERLSKASTGEYLIKLSGDSIPKRADAVVLTVPFSVLRGITLDSSLGLSPDKMRAINELGYGYNAKTMIGFQGRPWWTLHGSNGTAFSDLSNVQNTWETNYTQAGATSILTDYSGGDRGKDLQVVNGGTPGYCSSCHVGTVSSLVIDDTLIQQQVDGFLTDLDMIYPGVKSAATRIDGKYFVHRAHWLPQPYSKGSYTCYLPGQFTSIAGLEGQSAGLLKFAGEHANSFYEWQGYMEGAALSGIAAAKEILDDIKGERL